MTDLDLPEEPPTTYDVDPAVARRAALTVCDRLPKPAATEVLAMLGLIAEPVVVRTHRRTELGRSVPVKRQRK